MNRRARRQETDTTSSETGGATKTLRTVSAGDGAVEETKGVTRYLLNDSADGSPVSVKTLVSLKTPKDGKKKGKKREGPTLAERWANSPEWKGEQTEAPGEMGGGSLEPER